MFRKVTAFLSLIGILITLNVSSVFAGFSYEPVEVTIPVQVKDFVETSVLTIVEDEGSPVAQVPMVRPDENGKAEFTIRFSEPGTYTYEVIQNQFNSAILTNPKSYLARVFVNAEGGSGQLNASLMVYISGTDTKPDGMLFVNRLTMPGGDGDSQDGKDNRGKNDVESEPTDEEDRNHTDGSSNDNSDDDSSEDSSENQTDNGNNPTGGSNNSSASGNGSEGSDSNRAITNGGSSFIQKVQTGDYNNMLLWGLLVIAAGTCVVLVLKKRR